MAKFRALLIGTVAIMAVSPSYAADPQEMKERTAFIADRYLQIWSSSNVNPVAGVPYMYGRTVLFYGKPYTQADLQAEKQRAISQWPVRHYVHRPGTLRVICNTAARKCAARSTIDFTVANPKRGTRKSGSAKFDLGVSFAGPHPVILYEGGSLNRRRSSENAEGNG
ncbi:hypothetical protein CIW48_24665 [Methylobacterium sp. P1-11]|uniref:hypothetical protein n=1 Tax=Methylobacterium sp. P1-11 TaxID=2024616 RepID=UPI0011F01DCC|nr:hypothetical protein [Methylobacterium sp. P1-11]KAA0121264.1 hypothetical protein CIW48_24665 [Methylobacterium sp. P1-11]